MDGFEGLITKLIEDLTGYSFCLATSGYQGGRDISSSGLNSNSIAVECKRYAATNLNVRDLQGGLTQSVENIPDLDLWVLVTSRNVPSQVNEALRQQANREGIVYFAISADNSSPSSLELLCANSINTVSNFLGIPDSEPNHQTYLRNISERNDFREKINQLRDQFSSPLVGYKNWKTEQNKKFENYLKSENESRIEFGQTLNVSDQRINFVRRSEAFQELDSWIKNWPEFPAQKVFLGEEGCGKTWCVASWLSEKIRTESDFPPVIFLSSERVSSDVPIELFQAILTQKTKNSIAASTKETGKVVLIDG